MSEFVRVKFFAAMCISVHINEYFKQIKNRFSDLTMILRIAIFAA